MAEPQSARWSCSALLPAFRSQRCAAAAGAQEPAPSTPAAQQVGAAWLAELSPARGGDGDQHPQLCPSADPAPTRPRPPGQLLVACSLALGRAMAVELSLVTE